MKKIGMAVAIGGLVFAVYWALQQSAKPAPPTATPMSETVVPPQPNELPDLPLTIANGEVQSARELPGNSILIIYFPDCDHCQREAQAISSNLMAFASRPLWFITSASQPEIDKFADTYRLAGHTNIHFARTDMRDVVRNFGSIPTPSVYLYSPDKRLVKAFKGETPIDEIMRAL